MRFFLKFLENQLAQEQNRNAQLTEKITAQLEEIREVKEALNLTDQPSERLTFRELLTKQQEKAMQDINVNQFIKFVWFFDPKIIKVF